MNDLRNFDNRIQNMKPERVISLVPSITQSLIDLGYKEKIVGCTDYCELPKNHQAVRVGGPKTPDIQEIKNLRPDCILVEKSENSISAFQELQKCDLFIQVWDIKTTEESIAFLYDLCELLGVDKEKLLKIQTIEKILDITRLSYSNQPKFRFICPVFPRDIKDYSSGWYVFNKNTYASNLLASFGGVNCFAEQINKDKPNSGYPIISEKSFNKQSPDIILLPDEPYEFSEKDIDYFHKASGFNLCDVKNKIKLVSGKNLFWFGTWMSKSLAELPEIFQQ